MPRAHDPLWDDFDAIFAPRNVDFTGIGKAFDRLFDSFDVPCFPEGSVPPKHHRKNAGERALAKIAAAPAVYEFRTGRKPGGDFTLRDFSFRYHIGGGAFGNVHLAKCNLDGKFYAIKSQRKMKMADHYKQCNEEIRLQRKCRKPYVANLIGTFQDSLHLFMVLELCAGDFSTLLNTKGVSTYRFGHVLHDILLIILCSPSLSKKPGSIWVRWHVQSIHCT